MHRYLAPLLIAALWPLAACQTPSKPATTDQDSQMAGPSEVDLLRRQVGENRSRLDTLQQEVAVLRRQVRETEAEPQPMDPRAQLLMRRQAAERELEQHRFMGRTEEHPAVIRTRQTIEMLDQQIKELDQAESPPTR